MGMRQQKILSIAQSAVRHFKSERGRESVSISKGSVTPVSYTHLDVYKRQDWWRFVPVSKAFDHIFTDQELYEEYKDVYKRQS